MRKIFKKMAAAALAMFMMISAIAIAVPPEGLGWTLEAKAAEAAQTTDVSFGEPQIIIKTSTSAFLNIEADETVYVDWGDGNIVEYINDDAGHITGDTGTIKIYCAGNIIGIDCADNWITSLDVSNCAALEYIDCSSNQLTSLDVSSNTALNQLYCYSNKLTALDISNNAALSWLDCYDNQLTTLDVTKNTALSTLHLSVNQLTSLDVSNNTVLSDLDCGYNKISELDISKNTALAILNCYDNQLSELDVSENLLLEYLDCSNNQLTELDIRNNTALNQLMCSYNQISTLDASNNTQIWSLLCNYNQLTSLILGNNDVLFELGCRANQLTELDVSGCPNLDGFWCDDNLLTELNIDGCNKLLGFSCSNNKLTELEIYSEADGGIELYCYNNQLTSLTVTAPYDVVVLRCHNNNISHLDLSGVSSIYQLICSENNLKYSDLPVNFFEGLYYEYIIRDEEGNDVTVTLPYYLSQANVEIPQTIASGNKLTDLASEYDIDGTITAYTWYDASDDSIVTPTTSENGVFTFGDDFVGKTLYCTMTNDEFPELVLTTTEVTVESVEIELAEPQITMTTTLEVGSSMDLTIEADDTVYIDWGDGNIVEYSNDGVTAGTDIKIYCNGDITTFFCYYCELTSLDVSKCVGLKFLDCNGNKLTSLDVGNCEALTDLICCSNSLTELNVSNNMLLGYLVCSSNPLVELDVSNNTELYQLECHNNQLTALDVSNNNRLEYFICSENYLTSLDISNNTKLWQFYCNNNKIAELDLSNNLEISDFTCNNNAMRYSTMKIDIEQIMLNQVNPIYVKCVYFPQAEIEIADTINSRAKLNDLATEYNIGGTITTYTWYDASDDSIVTPTTSENGVFTFGNDFVGKSLYCTMTNDEFPELVLTTTNVEVVSSGIDVDNTTGEEIDADVSVDEDFSCVDENNNLIDVSGIKLIVGNVEESNKKTVADAVAKYNEYFDVEQSTYAMYDISLVDKSSGAKVDVVDGQIIITLKIPENFPGNNKDYTFNLYHYKDDGTIEEIPITLTNGNSHFYFYADDFSPYVLTCIPSITLVKPTNLYAYTFGYTSIKMTWDAVEGADGYEIFRCDRAGQPYYYIDSVGADETAYRNIGLSTGTTYYYKVRAFANLDDGTKLYSDFSAYSSARPLPATPVVTVTRTSATTATVSWVKIYGATGYSVYRATEEDGTYTFVANLKSGDTTTYKATGLASTTTYYYKVRAYRQMGDDMMFGSYSKPAAALGAPAVPVITARSVGYTSAKVVWEPVANADGYAIYRCDVGGGAYSYIASVGADETSYTNAGLSTGTTYYYKVRAFVSVGSDKLYGNYSLCATARPIPATPVVTVTADSATTATVSWVRIYGATGYSVYRSTEKDGTYTFLAGIPSGDTVTYTDKNLDEGVTYYYKVRAYRQMGSDKMFSNYSLPVCVVQE